MKYTPPNSKPVEGNICHLLKLILILKNEEILHQVSSTTIAGWKSPHASFCQYYQTFQSEAASFTKRAWWVQYCLLHQWAHGEARGRSSRRQTKTFQCIALDGQQQQTDKLFFLSTNGGPRFHPEGVFDIATSPSISKL